MGRGRIFQATRAVSDGEFPRDGVPSRYTALDAQRAAGTTLEVQEQLGDGVGRTIAMGSTEGLKPGLEVTDSGAATSVPVGKATLGRIMDVLGNPLDEAGPIATEERWGVHRPAPCFAGQAARHHRPETGTKIIDLVRAYAHAGKGGLSGGAGVGKPGTPLELVRT
ncbi:F0F1 ATP synthase subunit beta, partial [Pseudomonas syringae]